MKSGRVTNKDENINIPHMMSNTSVETVAL